MKTDKWRIITSIPARGSWNMALDEAIMTSVGSKMSQPTLRLYSWEPACLSLGQAQPSKDVDSISLAHFQWDIVRRPTGGRAILHSDELTYSVIAAQDEDAVSGGVLESYRTLAAGLIRALEKLSIYAQADSTYDLPSNSPKNAPVCFEVPSNYEITVNGKKLIGSAQARRSGAVLQHGSFPLYGDLSRIVNVLRFQSEADKINAKERLLAHATTAQTALGWIPTWEQAARAFEHAFSECLEVDFIPSEPSTDELSLAADLQREKYAHPNWTKRV